jgi:hypothetical protein
MSAAVKHGRGEINGSGIPSDDFGVKHFDSGLTWSHDNRDQLISK